MQMDNMPNTTNCSSAKLQNIFSAVLHFSLHFYQISSQKNHQEEMKS